MSGTYRHFTGRLLSVWFSHRGRNKSPTLFLQFHVTEDYSLRYWHPDRTLEIGVLPIPFDASLLLDVDPLRAVRSVLPPDVELGHNYLVRMAGTEIVGQIVSLERADADARSRFLATHMDEILDAQSLRIESVACIVETCRQALATPPKDRRELLERVRRAAMLVPSRQEQAQGQVQRLRAMRDAAPLVLRPRLDGIIERTTALERELLTQDQILSSAITPDQIRPPYGTARSDDEDRYTYPRLLRGRLSGARFEYGGDAAPLKLVLQFMTTEYFTAAPYSFDGVDTEYVDAPFKGNLASLDLTAFAATMELLLPFQLRFGGEYLLTIENTEDDSTLLAAEPMSSAARTDFVCRHFETILEEQSTAIGNAHRLVAHANAPPTSRWAAREGAPTGVQPDSALMTRVGAVRAAQQLAAIRGALTSEDAARVDAVLEKSTTILSKLDSLIATLSAGRRAPPRLPGA